MRCPPNQHLAIAARCPDAPIKKPENKISGFFLFISEDANSQKIIDPD